MLSEHEKYWKQINAIYGNNAYYIAAPLGGISASQQQA